MKNHIVNTAFYGVANGEQLQKGLETAIGAVDQKFGIFLGDNLFTYHKNLGFLDDEKFMNSLNSNISMEHEKSIAWRASVALWAFRNGLRLEGDFVECACYRGTTAKIICDTVQFYKHRDRKYYLYDLFEHDPIMPHHAMAAHSETLYDHVRKRFSSLSNVIVTKGRVPDILAEVCPEKIAFLNLHLNNAEAEVGVLDFLFERIVPGAAILLDDYGWLYYREQKLAEDDWFGKRGYRVLELPTGQGLVIK